MAAGIITQVGRGKGKDRAAAAAAIVERGDVIEMAKGAGWIVVDRATGSGRGHLCAADRCDCGDHVHRGRVCKHMIACRKLLGRAVCATCGAYSTPHQHYVAGAYVWFAVCTADKTHQAQPVAQ